MHHRDNMFNNNKKKSLEKDIQNNFFKLLLSKKVHLNMIFQNYYSTSGVVSIKLNLIFRQL